MFKLNKMVQQDWGLYNYNDNMTDDISKMAMLTLQSLKGQYPEAGHTTGIPTVDEAVSMTKKRFDHLVQSWEAKRWQFHKIFDLLQSKLRNHVQQAQESGNTPKRRNSFSNLPTNLPW
eukprot:GHVU01078617.1.p2 GENE.GHVU01078617.1~~GHVU01078617.1.p2  ORF type:complete len:118 (+),score=14.97 GHVU01078617.1:666-1019(+)